MKSVTIFLLSIIFIGCNTGLGKSSKHKTDTVYIYFTDTPLVNKKYSEVYKNFTKTRNVTFEVDKSYRERKYAVRWYLWIDGDIAESTPGIIEYVAPENLERYKAKIMKQENDRLPELLKVWNIKD